MRNQRGSALILALLMLAFFMVVGGALLTSVTLDIAIGENYRSDTQLLYLAEAGIADARGALAVSTLSPSALLAAAAGADGKLSTARTLDTLLDGSDDIAFIRGADRRTGKQLLDAAGEPAGNYFVFLRNDSADGMSSVNDTNQTLTLLSIAVAGSAVKIIEVTVTKWKFPKLPAALVLNGTPVAFHPSAAPYGISGIDAGALGDNHHAIEVLNAADRNSLLAAIPDADEALYPGSGAVAPPPADVAALDAAPPGVFDPRLTTPAGIEHLVDSISASATDVFNPPFGSAAAVGNLGSSADFRVAVVHGDCVLASITGYGILLVRGNLQLAGNFHWTGLILAIGQGAISWSGAGHGEIAGNVFVARTRASDRNAANLLGTILADRGAVAVDFSGGGAGSIQLQHPGREPIDRANQKFPWVAIAGREY